MCATRASRDSISVVAGAAVVPALIVSEAAAERWGFAALRSSVGFRSLVCVCVLRCGDLSALGLVWVGRSFSL